MSVSPVNDNAGSRVSPLQAPPDPIARLTDAQGNVSKDAFVSNRPPGVSEAEAAELWGKIDTAGTGTISAATLREGLKANAPPNGQHAPPKAEAAAARTTPLLSESTVSSLVSELQRSFGGQDAGRGGPPPPPREPLA